LPCSSTTSEDKNGSPTSATPANVALRRFATHPLGAAAVACDDRSAPNDRDRIECRRLGSAFVALEHPEILGMCCRRAERSWRGAEASNDAPTSGYNASARSGRGRT
jgi:hypothetical protein